MANLRKCSLFSAIAALTVFGPLSTPGHAYIAEWSVTGLYENILALDCRDCEEETGILFACTGNGQPAELTVNAAASPVGQHGAYAPVTFNIDGTVFVYEAETYEYGLIGFTPVFQIAYDDPLTEALQAGQQAIVTFNGQQGFIGLKGSRDALDIFRAHCGWTPQGFRSNLARTAAANPAQGNLQGQSQTLNSQTGQQLQPFQNQNSGALQGSINQLQSGNRQALNSLQGQLQNNGLQSGQQGFQPGQIRPLQQSGQQLQPAGQLNQTGNQLQQLQGQLQQRQQFQGQLQQGQQLQGQQLQGQQLQGQQLQGQQLQGQQLQGQQLQGQLQQGQPLQGVRPLNNQQGGNLGGNGLRPLQGQLSSNQLNQAVRQLQGQNGLQQQAQLQNQGIQNQTGNSGGMPPFSQTVLARTPATPDIDGMFWFTGDGFGSGSARTLAYAIPESDGVALYATCDNVGRPGILLELFSSFGDVPSGSNVVAEFAHARGVSRYQGITFIDNEEYAGSRFLLDPRDSIWAILAQSPQFSYGIQGQPRVTLSGTAGAAALIEFGRACQQ